MRGRQGGTTLELLPVLSALATFCPLGSPPTQAGSALRRTRSIPSSSKGSSLTLHSSALDWNVVFDSSQVPFDLDSTDSDPSRTWWQHVHT